MLSRSATTRGSRGRARPPTSLIALLLALLLAPLALATPLGQLDQDGLERFLAEVGQNPSLVERMEALSSRMLGTPYVLHPMGDGEGTAVDPKPLMNLKAVDCMTFVEHVLALGQARRLPEAQHVLNGLRYRGDISYQNRNHFVAPQWLPHMLSLGLLADASQQVVPGGAKVLTKGYPDSLWTGRNLRWATLLGPALPKEQAALPYVPLKLIPSHGHNIPDGSVAMVVLEPRASSPILVCHMGLIFSSPQGKVFRHASAHKKKVVNEDLTRYAAGLKRRHITRPVLGLAIFRVVERE